MPFRGNGQADTERGVLMQGNEACAEGALAAGVGFFAGYPITPSTEIAEYLSERLPEVGGKFIQMEDEIASMAAVIGASLTGVKAMTATSGPGFSLKQENLGYAALAEVPCVIVNVQRVGPSTGMPTSPSQGDVMQARWGTHGDHPIIVLAPFSVPETFWMTVQAFNWAEELRVPVILLLDEVVAHMRERVELPPPGSLTIVQRKKPAEPPGQYRPYRRPDGSDIPPMASFGDGYRFHVTGLFHDEWGFPVGSPLEAERLVRRLCGKVENRRRELTIVRRESLDDAEVAVFAFGAAARSALRGVRLARQTGLKAGLFRPVTLWPFPEEAVAEMADTVKAVVVAEMNLGQMAREVERAVCNRVRVYRLNKVSGEMFTPDEIVEAIRAAASGQGVTEAGEHGYQPVPSGR